VEVTFLAYAGTLQAEALGLLAAKTRASLMIEGELPEEGLAALDGDGSDVYLALARRLAEPDGAAEGQTRSLEALFAEARRRDDEGEESLVAEGWDDEPEVARERLLFTAGPSPATPSPVDALPLFGPVLQAATLQASAPTGTVVTFEELARLLTRRKRRPRSVSEAQLTLFGG